MDFGERLKSLREKKQLTQEELASRLYVSSKTISSWESSRTEPSLDLIVKLSEILECSYASLLYGDIKKSDLETEIKIRLNEEEFERLKLFFEASGEFINESRQIDTYFEPSYRSFLKDGDEEVEEWLRIGLRGNKKILNYKHWYQNKYCDEYEVTIDDEEMLEKIFVILGLRKIAVVDKKRYKFMYLEKYEVALDYVEDLGYFVEIEVKKYTDNAYLEYDNLIDLAKELKLDLRNLDKRGYPYHLIYKDK